MTHLLRFFILFFYIFGSATSLIRDVYPRDIFRNFAQEIDDGVLLVETTVPTNDTIVVTSERIFDHERLPFPDSQTRCTIHKGRIVSLLEMREKYLISCCEKINSTFQACPRIPIGDSHILFDLQLTEERPLYFSLSSGGEWKKSNVILRYTYSDTTEAIIRIVLAVCALSIALFCSLHLLVGTAHQFSNKYPRLSVNAHVIWTIIFTIFLIFLLLEEENPLLMAGIFHTLLQTSFSLLLVYIPSDGINTVDQRFSVPSNTFCSKLANHPQIKYFAVNVFSSSLVCSTLSTYSIFCVLWDRFDAAFDILFFITFAQILLLLVFYIAFLTAIYDIHSPLRMDSQMVVLQSKGISPFGKILMYNPETKHFEAALSLRPQSVLACVARGSGLHSWEVGSMTKNGIKYHKHIIEKISKHTCRSDKYSFIVPEQYKKNHRIPLYSVDKKKSLFKIGVLQQRKENKFECHLYHTHLLKFFELLLKIVPEIDDSGQEDYKINIVENVRSYSQQSCQNKCSRRPKIVSIVYWIAFSIVFGGNLYLLVYCIYQQPSWWIFYAYELLFLACMVVFATHVSTKQKFVLSRQNASKFSLKRSAGDTALKLLQGSETDVFQDETVSISPIANSTNPSICFVLVLDENDKELTKILWNAQCPQKHGLRCMKTTHPNWMCDQCEKSLQCHSTVWYCQECNWCQCDMCAPLCYIQQSDGSLNVRIGKSRPLSLHSIEYYGRWKIKING